MGSRQARSRVSVCPCVFWPSAPCPRRHPLSEAAGTKNVSALFFLLGSQVAVTAIPEQYGIRCGARTFAFGLVLITSFILHTSGYSGRLRACCRRS